jgi:iron complex outermembrane receptor protein
LWNGFNLNNLSLGQTDFSLIPAAAFSGIAVNMGAMGATGGNGVVAGAVSLENTNELKNGQVAILGGIQAGSFGKYSANAAITGREKKYTYTIKPFYFNAANRFSYLNPEGNKLTMQHAQSKLYGTLAAFHWYTTKNIFRFDTWVQASDRNIPSSLFEDKSQATQQDKSVRFTFNHYRKTYGWFNGNRLGYFYDQLDYNNQLTATYSGFKVHNLVGETESYWARGWSRHTLKLFGSAAVADNSGYEHQGEKMWLFL